MKNLVGVGGEGFPLFKENIGRPQRPKIQNVINTSSSHLSKEVCTDSVLHSIENVLYWSQTTFE